MKKSKGMQRNLLDEIHGAHSPLLIILFEHYSLYAEFALALEQAAAEASNSELFEVR